MPIYTYKIDQTKSTTIRLREPAANVVEGHIVYANKSLAETARQDPTCPEWKLPTDDPGTPVPTEGGGTVPFGPHSSGTHYQMVVGGTVTAVVAGQSNTLCFEIIVLQNDAEIIADEQSGRVEECGPAEDGVSFSEEVTLVLYPAPVSA